MPIRGHHEVNIDKLLSRKINYEGDVVTCAICLQDVLKDEEVIKLSCNENHLFHCSCIAEWAKFNAICPLCKTPIDLE